MRRWLPLLLIAGPILSAQRLDPPARPPAFRYWRSLDVTATPQPSSPSACALLEAEVFAHTSPTLSDIRLFTSLTQQERPFAITLSRTAATQDPATLLNAGTKGPKTLSFDLVMPPRAYSAVLLNLNARDFVGTASVTGLTAPGDAHPVYLGVFPVYDLTSQHLGRSVSLPLAESTFPLLHVELELQPAAGNTNFTPSASMLTGVQVPPSRVAQTLYTPVAETSLVDQRPRQSVITFQLQAHVPVERVTFLLDPSERRNFSRNVVLTAHASNGGGPPEQITGTIARLHLTESGEKLDEQSLSIPAVLGANAQSGATIEVAIENGDDQPLKLTGTRLEMRQRKICFGAPTSTQPERVQMFYGGTDIPAPVYDFGRIFNPALASRDAVLGPEHSNKSFHPVPRRQSLTEEYPAVLWIALLGSLATLGFVAFRSARRLP